METKKFLVPPKSKLNLSKFPTNYSGEFKSKKEAVKILKKNIERMTELQAKLYAQDKYSLLIVFQAMDAAGKDGTIKHVMSGLNPQGTQVSSFKQPSKEELGPWISLENKQSFTGKRKNWNFQPFTL